MPPSLIPYISKVNILPILLSDNSPIITSLIPASLGTKHNRWRFNTSLLQDCTFVAELHSSLTEFLQINRDSASDPQVLWETTKCFIRGKCLIIPSFNKKHRKSHKFELEKQIDLLEKELKDNFCETKAKIVNVLISELKSIYLHRAEFIIHCTRQSYYFHGERSSKLLALRLKDSESKTNISAIRHEGSVYTQPKDVNRVFENYYQDLYTSESNSDPTNFDLFLKNFNLLK